MCILYELAKNCTIIFFDQYPCGFQDGNRWFTEAKKECQPPLFPNRAGDFLAHGSPSYPPFARGKQPNLREVASSIARNFISNTGHNTTLTAAIPD
jgi:hypothetical protein